MKRVVLISVLSLLDVQLWGSPDAKIHIGFWVSSADNLYVAPHKMLFSGLGETASLQNKNALYLSPLKSEAENPAATNLLNPPAALPADESSSRILVFRSAPNRKRSNNLKHPASKPSDFQIKAPP